MRQDGEGRKRWALREKVDTLKERRIWRIILNKYFIVAFIFLIVISFIDSNSIGRYFRNRATLRAQKEQILFYEREIKAIEAKLEHLNSRRDSLEKFAREEYYYLEEGETVYLVEGEDVPSSSEE